MALMKCVTPFVAVGRTVLKGDLIDDGDSVVKGREAFFAPLQPTSTSKAKTVTVEQATAAPGEKRTRASKV